MSQHDMVIDNQTRPNFRADLNNALAALASFSSGTSAPSTIYANQPWYDSANDILKMRNEANSAWINLFTLDQANAKISQISATQIGVNTASPIRALTIESSSSAEIAWRDTSQGSDLKNYRAYLTGGSFILGTLNDAGNSGTAHISILRSTGAVTFAGDINAPSISGSVIASVAEMESGSATDKVVTPGRQHRHPSAVKAAILIPSNIASIPYAYNVSSLTDTATGRGVINLSTVFSSGNYAATLGFGNNTGVENTAYKAWVVRSSASAINVAAQDTDGNTNVDVEMHVIVVGDQ